MEFKKYTLDNGLTIIGEINPAAKSSAVGFFVKTGSRDETKEISGVSHFLEHMIFKGTEKLSTIQVNEAFDKTGAQFNAFTSEEITVFYAAILPEYLLGITSLWIELMNPALRDDDFDIEKNVIKEEIAMYKDQPDFVVTETCRNLYFGKHPCGNSVLGSVKSIENLSAGQMRAYFSERYAPNNRMLAVAGNFEWDKICQLAVQSCSAWQKKETSRDTSDYPGAKKKKFLKKSRLARQHICLMTKAVPAQDNSRFAAHLLCSIIGDSTGSRFFWEIVDKALAEIATMHFGAMDGTGIFQTYIQCSPENSSKVMDVVNNIFTDVSEKGITEDELVKAKNKTLSALVIKNELPMGRLIDLGLNWTYLNQYRTISDDIDSIKAVTKDEILNLVKRLSLQDFTIVYLGPG